MSMLSKQTEHRYLWTTPHSLPFYINCIKTYLHDCNRFAWSHMYINRDPLLRFIGAIRLFLYKKKTNQILSFYIQEGSTRIYRPIFITFQMQNRSLIADFAKGQWLHNIFSRNIFFNFPVRKTSKQITQFDKRAKITKMNNFPA